MSLTAEQSAELESAELSPTDTDESTEAPASGEQPAGTDVPADGEQPGEGAEKSEAEGEKPDEPTEEKKPERAASWKAVEVAKKAQIKLSQERNALNAEVQRVRDYEAGLDERASMLASRESKVAPLLEALESKDVGKLIALGFDYEAFTRVALERQTPEGMVKALREEMAEKDRKAEEERARSQAQQQQIAEQRQVAQTLVRIVEDEEGAKDYPDLALWLPERIAEEGLALRAQFFRKYRKHATYGQVLDELQARAKREVEHMNSKRAPQQRSGANPSDAGSAGRTEPKGASGSPGAPAIGGRAGNERVSLPREKTEAEIDAECLAELRGLKR